MKYYQPLMNHDLATDLLLIPKSKGLLARGSHVCQNVQNKRQFDSN